MKILFLGDIIGRSGREAVLAALPEIRQRLSPDLIVVNGENSAHGFGITAKICQEFYAAGVDVITLGNHSWDQKEIVAYIDGDPRLLRPLNFPSGTPGRGITALRTERGKNVVVMQVIGRQFMEPMDSPFAAVEKELTGLHLGRGGVDAILVDIHAEASSEKMGLAHMLDGRVSAVVGSHSHIPTADVQILPHGTAYQTDAGMCGDYNSVIGMKPEAALFRMTRRLPGDKLAPAEGPATVCGLFVQTDDATGLARAATALRLGPRLAESWPVVLD